MPVSLIWQGFGFVLRLFPEQQRKPEGLRPCKQHRSARVLKSQQVFHKHSGQEQPDIGIFSSKFLSHCFPIAPLHRSMGHIEFWLSASGERCLFWEITSLCRPSQQGETLFFDNLSGFVR